MTSLRQRFLLVTVLACWSAAALAGDNPYPRDWFWGKDAQRAEQDALLGKPAPPLEGLADWINGQPSAQDLKGKIIVVDFWATWCGPCLASIPHNNELAARYADQGVIVLGVCGSSRGQEKLPQIAKDKKISYPVARDVTLKAAKTWHVRWWPTYGVIDRHGDLRALGLKPSAVEKVIDDLLQQQPAEQNAESDSQAAAIPADWLEGDADQRARFAGLEGTDDPPALTVERWVNSEPLQLADLKGKVVLLDFWATWCGPCLASIAHTNELAERYKDQGLVVIGVCHSRGGDKMEQIAQDRKIAYPIACDVEQQTNQAYRVNGYPDYYLIDRTGRLRIADCANGKVEDAVKLLLSESAASSDDASDDADPSQSDGQ